MIGRLVVVVGCSVLAVVGIIVLGRLADKGGADCRGKPGSE